MPHKDRRESEYWLQEALEKAIFHRFCRPTSPSRALILHGKREDSFADFALLDAHCQLILIEVKPTRLTPRATEAARAQILKYINKYRVVTLGDHATWYCRHGVDVASWFEYRDAESLTTKRVKSKDRRFGRLIIEGAGSGNFHYYLEGAHDPKRALAILSEDYKSIVGRPLGERGLTDTLPIARCILISPNEPEKLDPIDGVPVEGWRLIEPQDWLVAPP